MENENFVHFDSVVRDGIEIIPAFSLSPLIGPKLIHFLGDNSRSYRGCCQLHMVAYALGDDRFRKPAIAEIEQRHKFMQLISSTIVDCRDARLYDDGSADVKVVHAPDMVWAVNPDEKDPEKREVEYRGGIVIPCTRMPPQGIVASHENGKMQLHERTGLPDNTLSGISPRPEDIHFYRVENRYLKDNPGIYFVSLLFSPASSDYEGRRMRIDIDATCDPMAPNYIGSFSWPFAYR